MMPGGVGRNTSAVESATGKLIRSDRRRASAKKPLVTGR